MQCMKFFRSNLQNPSQKLHKNLFDFGNPQILQKSQNLGYKVWNAWKWGIRDLPREEKLDEARKLLKEEVRSEWESVW